jgi:hypothetical protein
VNPGTRTTGQPPKYSENLSASRVALIRICYHRKYLFLYCICIIAMENEDEQNITNQSEMRIRRKQVPANKKTSQIDPHPKIKKINYPELSFSSLSFN